MTSRNVSQTGFTLIEMAMVLLIVALLLGGGLTVLSAQIEQQKFKDTQKSLEDAKEALIGYAASHTATTPTNRPYLPCPDKTAAGGAGVPPNLPNDGLEDRTGAGGCVVAEGNLPWVDLGLVGTDGWGNRLRYRVTPAFSDRVAGMQLTSVGTLNVNDAQAVAVAQAINVPAVILSHGPNTWGATSGAGAVIAQPPAANVNEINNANAADNTFISNPPVQAGGVGGEFDDIVVWLPPSLLFTRMLQAGKWQ